MTTYNSLYRYLYLCYQNARGMRTQCLINDFDFMLFTEAWLQNDILDTTLCDSRYDIFRCDRNLIASVKKSGGKVMVCTRRDFDAVDKHTAGVHDL